MTNTEQTLEEYKADAEHREITYIDEAIKQTRMARRAAAKAGNDDIKLVKAIKALQAAKSALAAHTGHQARPK